MILEISNPTEEGVLQSSKYLQYCVLSSKEELAELMADLSSFWIYPLTALSSGDTIVKERFLEEYGRWIEGLQEGKIPDLKDLQPYLASGWTLDPKALYRQRIPQDRFLVKLRAPVLFVQAHFFCYSPVDESFRSMTRGAREIFWGLHFSFPQIYQDPKTMELCDAKESGNWALFEKVRHWVRDFTRATPFVIEGKKRNVPIRLGKSCFSWIESHPQLKEQGISVYV